MKLNLKRPIVFFDLETTGVDTAKDRIVEISMVKVMPDGEPISIGFKSTFLVEILSNMDTPTVVVELADSTRAGVFKPVYDDKQTSATLMLLMPMMINA